MLSGKQNRDRLLVDLLQSQKISIISNLLVATQCLDAPFTNSIKILKPDILHLDFTNMRLFLISGLSASEL